MLKFIGGERAGKGTYWNFENGARVDISTEGILPGDPKAVFYRMPAVAIIVIAPVLGLLYAGFLPFIGIAMMTKLLLNKAGGGVFDAIQTSASFAWRPSESYLTGMRKMKKEVKVSWPIDVKEEYEQILIKIAPNIVHPVNSKPLLSEGYCQQSCDAKRLR